MGDDRLGASGAAHFQLLDLEVIAPLETGGGASIGDHRHGHPVEWLPLRGKGLNAEAQVAIVDPIATPRDGVVQYASLADWQRAALHT